MREENFEKAILRTLREAGYSPKQQPSVSVGGHYYNGDIRIMESDTVIEIKTSGSVRKGIGQCLSYKRGGHNTALIVDNAYAHERDIFDLLDFPLIKAEVKVFRAELECLRNEDRFIELFSRLANPQEFHNDEMAENYRKYAPDPEMDFL